jgi:hypothetical protein
MIPSLILLLAISQQPPLPAKAAPTPQAPAKATPQATAPLLESQPARVATVRREQYSGACGPQAVVVRERIRIRHAILIETTAPRIRLRRAARAGACGLFGRQW